MSYPDTFYSRSLADRRERPALNTHIDAEIAIVGAGLAGLTIAQQVARAGKSVALIDAQSVGYGASGRNGGFVTPGYSVGDDEIAARIGADAARQLHLMSIEGVDHVRENIRMLAITGADPHAGITRVLRHAGGGDTLRRQAERSAREYDYPLQFLETEEVRSVMKTRRYFEGLRDPSAFHIHPLNYARGLAADIEANGGRIYENSPVTGFSDNGTTRQVLTRNGSIKAQQVVFSTGGYTTALFKPLQRAFLPIATYVMICEPAPELLGQAILTRDAIGDERRAGDYYRLVDGGRRLLWGGRITTRAASPEKLAHELRREMLGVYPQLAPLKTELAWSGLMSYARHLMPQIGQFAPGVWYCTAFGGHGLNTTAIGGKVVAEGLLGTSDRFRRFAPFGLNWAGGVAGLAVAQMTYWKLQAQDWWRERQSDAAA